MTALGTQPIALDAAPQWRIVDHAPAGFVTMAEAVRRAKASALWPGKRNAQAIYATLYRLAGKAVDDVLSPALFNGELFIPTTLHESLHTFAVRAESDDGLLSFPIERRNRGTARLKAIAALALFQGSPEGRALGLTEAVKEFVRRNAQGIDYNDGSGGKCKLGVSVPSLYAWKRLHETGGIVALAEDGRGGYDRRGPSQEAVDLFNTIRHDPRQFKTATAWRRVRLEARKRHWRWFESLSTCRAWDKRTRDDRALALNRRGEKHYRSSTEPYLESDPESFEPGQMWESDHTTINVWLRLANGRIVRPVLTLFLDWRSRTVVGFKLVVSGNQESILAAFGSGCRAHGVPDCVKFDNGKDFSAWAWTGGAPKRLRQGASDEFVRRIDGLAPRLGVNIQWATPYTPNAKARIERHFRTLDDQFCRVWPSYCGNTPDNRPEAHRDLVDKAVDFAEFAASLAKWIAVYNETPHSGEGMDGRTPLQVISLATRRRVLTDGQADELLAMWPKPVNVQRFGVGIRIAGTTLHFGAFEPAIRALAIGTQVRVSYDPDDLSAVKVWHVDGRFICHAQENHRFNRSLSSEQLRETLRTNRKARRAIREARKAGSAYLGDPVAQTIAAQAADSARRRLPDPDHPEGGPNLVPVQTSIEVPSKPAERLRRVVGEPDAMSDAQERLNKLAAASAEASKRGKARSAVDPLLAWSRREGMAG
jgi:transposase InsO family protein